MICKKNHLKKGEITWHVNQISQSIISFYQVRKWETYGFLLYWTVPSIQSGKWRKIVYNTVTKHWRGNKKTKTKPNREVWRATLQLNPDLLIFHFSVTSLQLHLVISLNAQNPQPLYPSQRLMCKPHYNRLKIRQKFKGTSSIKFYFSLK